MPGLYQKHDTYFKKLNQSTTTCLLKAKVSRDGTVEAFFHAGQENNLSKCSSYFNMLT